MLVDVKQFAPINIEVNAGKSDNTKREIFVSFGGIAVMTNWVTNLGMFCGLW